MKQKLRRTIAGIGAAVVLLSYKTCRAYHPQYEILDNDLAYASYRSGLIYIGNGEDYLDYSLNDGDVYVLDSRNDDKSPDMKIMNSYKIRSVEERNDILEVLCYYEECNPSDWDRSLESMQLEWTIHNISHFFNYQRGSSTDVDLDNEDEEKYDSKVLQKLFH